MSFRNIFKLLVILLAATALTVSAAKVRKPKRTIEDYGNELELLKGFLEDARDSLQRDITQRWSKKQRYIVQREVDKEEMGSLKSKQERLFSQLSQVKEECFAKERMIEDEKVLLQKKKDEWTFLKTSFDEIYDKESKLLDERMPLDLEDVRAVLNENRRDYLANAKPVKAAGDLIDYYLNKYRIAGQIITEKKTVMPDAGDPVNMSIVRFGDIVAYGINDTGAAYVIRQTGKLGAGKYTVELVGSADLAENIQLNLPVWRDGGKITGELMMDIMQNSNSSMLISGKKVNATTRIAIWFKAGGAVMLPLMGLLIWAFILIIIKLIQYSLKHKDYEKVGRKVVKMLKEDRKDDALKYAKNHKGVVAKVVKTCLEHSKWNRASAEKSVREILLEEVPQLNSNLATLGVIAGAAPLLGLLGTVTGMINLFEVITHYGTGDPKILAGGISEALVTTQTGLAIAIPILLVHNYMRNRSNHIQAEMQKHAVRILNRLWPLEDR